MANMLDEMNDETSQGRDARVINKQLPITVGKGSLFFEIILWVLGILPGIIFLIMKIKAKNRLDRLEQNIQSNASQIDNYLEQRVIILRSCASLVSKAVDLDKKVFADVAAYRAGSNPDAEVARELKAGEVESMNRSLNLAFEQYPELQAHQSIQEAMRQNSYLQREITAARDLYNDSVYLWNSLINQWPTYKIVAAKNKLTTRVPFSTTNEIRQQARDDFFADSTSGLKS